MNNDRIHQLATKVSVEAGTIDLIAVLMIISILVELARLIQSCKNDHHNIMSNVRNPRLYERVWLIRKCKVLMPNEYKHLAPKLAAAILKVMPEYSIEDFNYLASQK
jgi:hypothetical protein